jgi:hypothetical protein
VGAKEMSPSAATASARIAGPSGREAVAPQLERVVEFKAARWLPSVLSDLRTLELAGADVPGIGDFRVGQATANNVRRLLTIISGSELPEPKLAPFAGGGVALTCSIGNRDLTFTAYPDHGEFVFSNKDENDDLVDDGMITLEQQGQLNGVIAAFLAR